MDSHKASPVSGVGAAGSEENVADGPLTYPFDPPAALEPAPEWARLRADCPVAPVQLASGDQVMLLTRYEDVRAVLADPRCIRDLGAEDAAQITATGSGVFNNSTSGMDAEAMRALSGNGPEHQRWRRLLSRSFTAKRAQALEPRMEQIAEHLIDEMIASGSPADLRPAFAFPLPVYVICELLGVPHEDHDRFSYWSDAFLSADRYTAEEMRSAAADFDTYMREHVAAKRAAPGEDLLSELAAVVDGEDGTLSEGELIATGKGLLVAGHETTANMIGKMVSMLLADRSRWEQVLADPSLIRSAVEESLRFDANLGLGMARYLLEDLDVAGEILPQGTTVMTNMSSANRDERTFTGAETMDLTRSPNPHITFGAGPHSCLGQALARTELQTALRVLTRRLPTLELDVEAEQLRRLEGLLVGGLEQIPVRW